MTSDASGKATGPLSLVTCLDAVATERGSSLAITHRDIRLTWSDVAKQSREVAKGLLAAGFSRGDNIALWLPNHPKWLLFWLGALRIGAAVVPINTRYKPSEAAFVLDKSEARGLVFEKSFLGTDFVEVFRGICPNWNGKSSADLPKLHTVIIDGAPEIGLQTYEEFLAAGADISDDALDAAEAEIRQDDTVIVVFTSGTTGNPKGVMHTHNALRMMQAVTDWMQIGPKDRILGHLPLFHVAGVFSSFLPSMIGGGAYVMLDRWDPAEALQLIARERVTVMSGVPTHFIDILRHPELAEYDVSSLRTGWIGGATVPAEVIAGARDKLGMDSLLPVYGMTETTSTTVMGRPGDPAENLKAGKGVPLGGYEVEVVDPETREPAGPGVEGEIRVRGYTIMKGYYQDEAATRAVLKQDGWFYTGDLGVFDEQGYLSITGRLTDKFVVGGNNVHPADIEHRLLAHPGIKQAHVVAGTDDRLGEVAVAFVEPVAGENLSEDEIITYCRENLASFKVPRNVIFVDDWPTTPTGKVQRFKLREIAAAHRAEPAQ